MMKESPKPTACREEDDYQAPRTWWEPPYVIYGFTNPRVRTTLERLMGTCIVRVTDREFMMKLQQRRREDHEEQVRREIHDLELGEVEREKGLILEGKMSVEDAPEELSNHPVFKISQLAKKIVQERKMKAEKNRRHKKVRGFNYELLQGKDEDVQEHSVTSCLELDLSDADRDRKIKDREEYIADGLVEFTDDDYNRIKYEDDQVIDLQELEEGVSEMYDLADKIVGPLLGKPCGGLVK